VVGVTEGQFLIIGLSLLTAIFGPGLWKINILFGFNFSDLCICLWILGAVPMIYDSIRLVMNTVRDKVISSKV
jgi:hypothetical protein